MNKIIELNYRNTFLNWKVILNSNNISQYYCFYFNIKMMKNITKSYWPQTYKQYFISEFNKIFIEGKT